MTLDTEGAAKRGGRYRSGEAARLANMPAATLRIWEQRYDVIAPAKSSSGQRLYSEADVRRLKIIKALVGSGHGIGSIAKLSDADLENLLSGTGANASVDTDSPPQVCIVGHVGTLERGSMIAGMCVSAVIPDLAVHQEFDATRYAPVDALFVSVTSLHEEAVVRIAQLANSLQADFISVAYGFGTSSALDIARFERMHLHQSIQSKGRLYELLGQLGRRVHDSRQGGMAEKGLWSRSMPRLTPAELESIAASDNKIACECPRHLVELIMRLQAFERYSDDCMVRSAFDALLHRHLGNLANRAASMLEQALLEISKETVAGHWPGNSDD